MSDRKRSINHGEQHGTGNEDSRIDRRKYLQLTGLGLLGAGFAAGRTAAAGDLPHLVVFDGSDASRGAYEFGVSEAVTAATDVAGVEKGDSIDGTAVTGTVAGDVDAYRFSGTLTHLDVEGGVEVSISYSDTSQPDGAKLEIVTPADGSVEYAFRVEGEVKKDLDNGDNAAEADNDTVTANDDGSHSVTGMTGNGYGDTYTIYGDVTAFEPTSGDFTLLLDGDQVTVPELLGQSADDGDDAESGTPDTHTLLITAEDSVEYSFRTAGEIQKDLENGRDSAEERNDEVEQQDDGTWAAAGLTGNGYGDTYVFEDEILGFEVLSGDCRIFLDGQEVSVAELGGEEPDEEPVEEFDDVLFVVGFDHDDWLPYRLHVDARPDPLSSEDDEYFAAGNYDLRELDDGTWIIEGRTGTADPSGPMYGDGYRWQPEEGTGILGWEADPVDGREYHVSINDEQIDPSTLPAFDPPEPTVPDEGGDVIGGGAGYSGVVPRSAADYSAGSASELADALGSASSGDVVYVTSDVDVGSGGFSVPDGVTLAGDRGIDGSDGPLIATDRDPSYVFSTRGGRITGIRLRGAWHGQRGEGGSGNGIRMRGRAEVDNCAIYGFGHANVDVRRGSGENHVHHNYIYDCNTNGLGYGVVVYGNSTNPLIERNYFNDNRHQIAASGDNYGYVCRYNHCGPRTFHTMLDVHDPGSVRTVFQNNIGEPQTRDLDGQDATMVAGTDTPADDELLIENNWWFVTEGEAYSLPETNTVVRDNHYTESAGVSYDDIIPNHPGSAHTPW